MKVSKVQCSGERGLGNSLAIEPRRGKEVVNNRNRNDINTQELLTRYGVGLAIESHGGGAWGNSPSIGSSGDTKVSIQRGMQEN